MKDIEEHFENLSLEEFEDNMFKAGAYKIKAAKEYGFSLFLAEDNQNSNNESAGDII
jgi:hypothetical protein